MTNGCTEVEEGTAAPAVGHRLDRGVRPLSPEATKLLDELVQRDPLLRLAFEQRCELKWNCQRGPFGCKCGRKIR